ncbi:MAG: hypothetical protein ACKPKP_01850 [Dolichospermum sp.]
MLVVSCQLSVFTLFPVTCHLSPITFLLTCRKQLTLANLARVSKWYF